VTILHTVQPSRVLVALAGDLDMTVAAPLREALDELVDRYPDRDLTLDLSEVGFVDSSGLGVMLGRYRRLAARGRQLTLVGVRPSVKTVLKVAGLTQILAVSDLGERLRDGHG
jgi:stage II sporulation protein AA (anti-sigma F factor antagonist)